MNIYSGLRPVGEELPVPNVDVWQYLLGGIDVRGIPRDKTLAVDVTTQQRITYGEARDLAERIAHGLRTKAGLKQGQTVCIFSANSVVWPVVAMAVQCASLIGALANWSYTFSELRHLLKDSGSVAIFASSDSLDTAEKAAIEVGIDPNRIYALPGMDGKVASAKQSYTILDSGKHWKHVFVGNEALATLPAYLPYSSGTTGLAKGVVMTARNVVSMSEILYLIPNFINRDTVMAVILPMFHAYALTVAVHHIIRVGATITILPKFDMVQFLNMIEHYKCTFAPIAPPVALGLVKHPAVQKERLTSLKRIICGAAPMSAEMARQVEQRTGVSCCQGFGMTETSAVAAIALPENNNHSSVGTLVPYVRARVIDENGNDVPRGQRGEIILAGENIIPRYHNNEKATKESYSRDGWLLTGDIVEIDEENRITIVDRRKELIKTAGFQVPPAELEALLLTSELCSDAAVIGVYSEEKATELPRAYVVLTDLGMKHQNAPRAISAFVADRTAHYKHLKGGVFVLDAIPKSASGKILRKDLRAMVAKEAKSKAKL